MRLHLRSQQQHHEEATQPYCNDMHAVSRRQIGQGTILTVLAALWGPSAPSLAALVEEDVSTHVFEQASPSVVSIINYKIQGGIRVVEGVGTGVIWDQFGHVVTNYHVIAKVDKSTIPQVRFHLTPDGWISVNGNTE